ncbi:MAG: hypothetical protein Fur006_52750 [Coleofasciculaceae cyanobacterium]
MDLELLEGIAKARPDWHLVMIGPVVKIDPASLPRRENIHYLGSKDYKQLPAYLAGWDLAMLPFARNESTRFISPTKTPEYLAAGKPVVSTSIRDVVRPYGQERLVRIADTIAEFVAAAEAAMSEDTQASGWLDRVDAFLEQISWDRTWSSMMQLIESVLGTRLERSIAALYPSTNGKIREIIDLNQPPAIVTRDFVFDYLVVGAGFSGSVIAERIASQLGKNVLVVDKRNHIGGNAYDRYDNSGILVHKYGPHIFHTNSREVFEYLSKFTEWRSYEHRVLASVDGQLLPIPINLDTINKLYGLNLTSFQVPEFFASIAEPKDYIRTSEDVVVSKVGRELYEKFFRNYTRKQWGLDPSELDKSVISRIPTRTNRDDRYFTDTYQAMPLHGFTPMFENMLNHPNINEAELEWFLDNPCPPDVLGINHYLTSERFLDERIERYPTVSHGGNGIHNYADVEAIRVCAEGTAGPRALMKEVWERYELPLAVTEVHLGCTREEQIRWLKEVWDGAISLRYEGVDVRAVTAWSLLGAYDWNFRGRQAPPKPYGERALPSHHLREIPSYPEKETNKVGRAVPVIACIW